MPSHACVITGVCVVNCARGGIIDEAALLKGLNSVRY